MSHKVVLLLFFTSILSYAQEDISFIKSYTLHSEVLGEDRKVWVTLPDNYHSNDRSYPVVYILDARTQYLHTVGLIDFLQDTNRMPETIIVGVLNTNRTRDFTPEREIENPKLGYPIEGGGGADNFVAFLGDELKPYIEKNYRAADFEILIGHSFGGLLATHTMLNKPELFDAYVALSPSLWWDDQTIIKDVSSFFEKQHDKKLWYHLSIANEGGSTLGGAYKLIGQFEDHSELYPDTKIKYRFKPFFEEDHGSVPHRGTYDALEFIFDGYYFELPIKDIKGSEEKTKSMVDNFIEHYLQQQSKFNFSLNIEGKINQLGYILLGAPDDEARKASIYAFKKNVENYPNSPNAYDSLGDAYNAFGEIEKAKFNYKKAIELAKKTGHPVQQASQEKLGRLEQQD